jgi:hypothetical protein
MEARWRNVTAAASFEHPAGTAIMTTFDKREEAFEKKFAIDAEQRFKAQARRNKLLGLWVAAQLGMPGDDANDYARTVVAAEFGTGVVSKAIGDLAAKGIAVPEAEIRTKMDELMVLAVAQVKAGN